MRTTTFSFIDHVPAFGARVPEGGRRPKLKGSCRACRVAGLNLLALLTCRHDPSSTKTATTPASQSLGLRAAIAADLVISSIGLASVTLRRLLRSGAGVLLTNRLLEPGRA